MQCSMVSKFEAQKVTIQNKFKYELAAVPNVCNLLCILLDQWSICEHSLLRSIYAPNFKHFTHEYNHPGLV